MENQRIIQVEDKVPFKLLVPLSIQHMFAMFGASILVPFLFGISPAVVLFTFPSAVHLPSGLLQGSHHPLLSVNALYGLISASSV